jgi:hypothetical protein
LVLKVYYTAGSKKMRKGNHALLFQDFVLTLAEEGFKRWLYIDLHDRITVEANTVYQDQQVLPGSAQG